MFVGYKVCFIDKVLDVICIVLMIDGIFLNEIYCDWLFICYDMIIIDEVYECFFNVDFLFGYFVCIFLECFDLKVIIILVMIDLESFVKYFVVLDGILVLIIEVFGCIYLVEICYCGLVDDVDDDVVFGGELEDEVFVIVFVLCEFDCELFGDVFVFLFGEVEIWDVVDVVCGVYVKDCFFMEVLLLFGCFFVVD